MRKFVYLAMLSTALLGFVVLEKASDPAKQQAQQAHLANVEASAGTRTALGPAVPLAHGLVQVRVTCMGSQIVDVQAVQLPHDNEHSWLDSLHAASVLRSEVLSKQTTNVDSVSGATYTSAGYLQSLNAALDLAAPPAPKMTPTPMSGWGAKGNGYGNGDADKDAAPKGKGKG